jgi:uncharacterized protein (TIGR03435 family)
MRRRLSLFNMRRIDVDQRSAVVIFGLHALVVLILLPANAASYPLSASTASAAIQNNIPSFAVASVRPNIAHDGRWKIEFTPNGFTALGVTLRQLIEEAYGIYEDDRILGESHQLDDQRYDIEAKVDDIDAARFLDLEREQRKVLLQRLLAERFKLKVHSEDKLRPIYKLVIAKSGPRFKRAESNEQPYKGVDPVASVKRIRKGHIETEQFTLDDFARLLSHLLERQVVNETLISGRYDLTLDWSPDDRKAIVPGASSVSGGLGDSAGPSLFTAVREQLGLQLISARGPIKVIVVDEAASATPN